MTKHQDSTLTTPGDHQDTNYKPDSSLPPLTDTETKEAVSELDKPEFISKYPTVERRHADPTMPLQQIGLISFVPAKGATPNKHGVYGFAKLRGNFSSECEANQRAEKLIREVDSYHEIYHCYVGRPFPVTNDFMRFVKNVEEIDLKKQVSESVSADIKKKKAEEKKTVQEIEERKKALHEDVKADEGDPYDTYTTLRVKLAQVGFAYLDMEKKKQQMKEIILKTRVEIEKMDEESEDYKNAYVDKYMTARQKAGIADTTDDNFIKYLHSDMKDELGF